MSNKGPCKRLQRRNSEEVVYAGGWETGEAVVGEGPQGPGSQRAAASSRVHCELGYWL